MNDHPHWDLIDERAFTVAREVIEWLQRRRDPYVLGGGWAVFAYGSPVPSVDTDVWISEQTTPRLADALRARFPGEIVDGRLELLDADGWNRIAGLDADLGDPEIAFVPARVLAGRIEHRDLGFPDGPSDVPVPEADVLCFLKLKAFHDRSLYWQAHNDPRIMARLHPTERQDVKGKTSAYFRRKAGKDLFDVAFLCAHHTDLERALAIADRVDMLASLAPAIARVPLPLRRFAYDMHEEPATRAWLERRLGLRPS